MSTIATDRFANLNPIGTPEGPETVKPKRARKTLETAKPATEINSDAFKVTDLLGSSTGKSRKARVDKNGVQRNALGLESTAEHKHVAKIWQDQCTPLADLSKSIAEEQKTKRDVIIPRDQLFLTYAGDTLFSGSSSIDSTPTPFIESGVRGLTDFTEIPTEMVKYMLREAHGDYLTGCIAQELQAKRHQGKNFTVRLRESAGAGEVIRHVASEGYATIDNHHVMEILHEACQGDFENVLVSHAKNDGDGLYMNLLFPDRMKSLPDSDYGVGVAIMNSEVGARKYQFSPFLFRAICLNGMIWGRMDSKESTQVKQKHYGEIDLAEIAARTVNSLEAALTAGWSLLDRMTWSHQAKIANVPGTIAHLARAHKVTKSAANAWYQAFQQEPEETGFGIIQGLTLAAQGYDGELRAQLESIAGDITAPSLDAPISSVLSYWDRVDHQGQHVPESIVQQYVTIKR